MSTEEDVAAGLLDWINSLEIADPIQKADDLNDGDVLWRLLQQIDKPSFSGTLPEDTNTNSEWVHKWTNLKHLYDALTVFLVEECGQRLPLFTIAGRTRPDLKAIAQHSSLPDLIILLKLCVVAAINCADRIAFLMKMQELGTETQNVLMTTAQEAGAGEAEESDEHTEQDEPDVQPSVAPATLPLSTGIDTDLASEERLGQVIADNERVMLEKAEVQRQLDDLLHRFEQLQDKHERTQDELNEANDRLTAVLAGKGEGQGNKQDASSESIIAALEARAGTAEAELDELRKSNEVLKIRSDRMQKLQDDYDEIKIERDKLSRKANTAEKYKQKLESLGDTEKELTNLRAKVAELQTQVRQSDSSQASTSGLHREIEEYRRLLPSIEQERYDLNEMKKRLEFDYHTLQARWHDLSEEHQRSQTTIEELEGRLREYNDGGRPSTPTRPEPVLHHDLEQEEAAFEEAEARLTKALLESANNSANTADKDSEAENGISEEELRVIMAAMRAQAQAGSATEQEKGMRAQKKLLVALERQRTKNQNLVDHVKKQSDLIQELRTKISSGEGQSETDHKSAVESATDTAPPPRYEPKSELAQGPTESEKAAAAIPASAHEAKLIETLQVNHNLRREVRLMTSAWYEQQQRISATSASGGSTLSLMRSKMGRHAGLDGPSSFLGRQRKLVDGLIFGNEYTSGG